MKWNKKTISEELKKQLPYLKSEYGVVRVAIFGSFARDDQRKDSDIDLMVEYKRPMGFKFFEMCDYFEKIFGRKVDVLTPASIKSIRVPKVKERIEQELMYV